MRVCGLLQPSWFTTSRLRHIAPGESGDSLGSARSFRCPPRWSVSSGLPCSDDWLTKMQPWVDQWEQADEHLVHPTGPHTDSSFRAYLTWYLPRTRARLVYVDTHRSHTRRGLRMAMPGTTWRH
ncbi:hypothetical protein PVAP13_6NG164612 [Panicum virgatum]|uniref:Uncharacterized protein n=1 Tax=Panicum virgatum TaxID=38727 RepID=A0A8T0QYJ0_PANVG|nr:hypothetical protein PVAP13_6NG164612 [Panicum virgatum]